MALHIPKEPRIEIPQLLLLARNQPRPCMLCVPRQCRLPGRHSEGQCFACHGNAPEFNKGGHIKAHDFFSVWGCSWCHDWLDSSYVASGHERYLAFREALDCQITEWAKIVGEITRRKADRDACTLALTHLTERGYARATQNRQHPYEPTYARF